MIMTLVYVIVQETLLEILNSHTYCMYLCRSQMTKMAAMLFFAEMLEWQWYYNPTLDSQYLMATSYVHLYIFFQHPFIVSIFGPTFDPMAPFGGIPMHMAHPAAATPQPSPSSSMEIDPSKAISSSSFFAFGCSGHPPDSLGSSGIIPNGFLSPELEQGIMQDLLRGSFGKLSAIEL